jgi:hypothetical protein
MIDWSKATQAQLRKQCLNTGGFDEEHVVATYEQFNRLLYLGGYKKVTYEQFLEMGDDYDGISRIFFDGDD